jgi:hypothetical protein
MLIQRLLLTKIMSYFYACIYFQTLNLYLFIQDGKKTDKSNLLLARYMFYKIIYN